MVGRGWTRRSGALAVAGLALLGVIGWTGSPAAADPAPTLTVTPTTDLLDRHPVRVHGTGYTPGEVYVVLDCTAEGCMDPAAYWLTMGGLHSPVTPWYDGRRSVRAAADGTIDTSLRVYRQIYLGDIPPPDGAGDDALFRDCSAVACSLAVVAATDDSRQRLVEVPVTFQATGSYTWTPGTLDVTTPERLPDQGAIGIQGTGWDPGSYATDYFGDKMYGVEVEMCATGPSAPAAPAVRCVSQTPWSRPKVDHDGVVDASVPVSRFLAVGGGLGWDCAAKPCSVRIRQGLLISPEVTVAFGPEWAPFTSASAFVDKLSRAVTGSVLPSAERTPLVNGLAGGTRTAASVLRTLVERPGAPAEVATLYSAILKRRPDTAGLAFWVGRRRTGTTAARIAEQFAGTAEVKAWHGWRSDTGAVDEVYQRVLGRSADGPGRDYWVGRLAAGLSREKMIASFALSPESRARTRSKGWWTAMTYGVQRRAPNDVEWNAASDVDQPVVPDTALRAALGSPEARALADAPTPVP